MNAVTRYRAITLPGHTYRASEHADHAALRGSFKTRSKPRPPDARWRRVASYQAYPRADVGLPSGGFIRRHNPLRSTRNRITRSGVTFVAGEFG
ncbi:hypothetical protein KCP69_11670 [Salmonella enterica subsp. enterica]|nr:hypothetical protein KCP69_11670 [Salmonella enterica subsp. enterica]